MFARSFSLLALMAFVSAAAATPALAGSCCACPYDCAPLPQIQVWGLVPSYVVNQGPVYTGPGFYTSPTYEGELSTAVYPYASYYDYPRHARPYDGEPYVNPFRRHVFSQWRPGVYPEEPFRFGYAPRAMTMSRDEHRAARSHKDVRDPGN